MKLLKIIVLGAALTSAVVCSARDDVHYFSIQEALNSPEAKKVLNPRIKLYFANSVSGKVLAKDLVSNKKTNGFNKTPKRACEWAFLSAVKSFQDRAASMGGTKVVNLVSYYKKSTFRSSKEFECHDGNLITGVALKGDIVK